MKPNFRKAILILHMTAGLWLSVVVLLLSVSGALLVFQPQLDEWLDPRLFRVSPGPRRLPIDAVLAAALSIDPQMMPESIRVAAAPERTAVVLYSQGELVYVNPYTAEVVGHRKRADLFLWQVQMFHQYLLMPPVRAHLASAPWEAWGEMSIGNLITGGSSVALFFILATGAYLWMPRTWKSVKAAFTFNRRLKGRALKVNVHKLAGIYGMILVAILAFTGAAISFNWVKNVFIFGPCDGAAYVNPVPPKSTGVGGPISLEQAWSVARSLIPNFRTAEIFLPLGKNASIKISVIAADTSNPDAQSHVYIDANDGKTLSFEPYAQASAGWRLNSWIKPLHKGTFGGLPWQLLIMAGTLCLAASVVSGWWMYYRRKINPGTALSHENHRRRGAPCSVINRQCAPPPGIIRGGAIFDLGRGRKPGS
jgi:uncharacterized iron-regulated membrane protein